MTCGTHVWYTCLSLSLSLLTTNTELDQYIYRERESTYMDANTGTFVGVAVVGWCHRSLRCKASPNSFIYLTFTLQSLLSPPPPLGWNPVPFYYNHDFRQKNFWCHRSWGQSVWLCTWSNEGIEIDGHLISHVCACLSGYHISLQRVHPTHH